MRPVARTTGAERTAAAQEGGLTLLADLLTEMRGDPRLTAWEEGFVTDLSRHIRDLGPAVHISARVVTIIGDLRAKTEAPPPPDGAGEDGEPDPEAHDLD